MNTNTKLKKNWATCCLAGWVTGQNFIVSRNICCRCWESEIEFKVLPTVQSPFLENILFSTLVNTLIKNAFTIGYNLFMTSSTSHADHYLTFDQT